MVCFVLHYPASSSVSIIPFDNIMQLQKCIERPYWFLISNFAQELFISEKKKTDYSL